MPNIKTEVIEELAESHKQLAEKNIFEPDVQTIYLIIAELLNELLERRKKDCNHQLIPVENEVVSKGYMCVLCGDIFEAAN
jgi:hypothetical protein